jgi:toxin ParE1/3/4
VGASQAERYLSQIEDCCHLLALNPGIGRACEEFRPGLCRLKRGKHVLFYRPRDSGILIVRILHQRMAPERHMQRED